MEGLPGSSRRGFCPVSMQQRAKELGVSGWDADAKPGGGETYEEVSKRQEVSLRGSWRSGGQMQVSEAKVLEETQLCMDKVKSSLEGVASWEGWRTESQTQEDTSVHAESPAEGDHEHRLGLHPEGRGPGVVNDNVTDLWSTTGNNLEEAGTEEQEDSHLTSGGGKAAGEDRGEAGPEGQAF